MHLYFVISLFLTLIRPFYFDSHLCLFFTFLLFKHKFYYFLNFINKLLKLHLFFYFFTILLVDYRPNTLISNSKLIVNCQRTAVLFVVFPFYNVYNSTTNPISTTHTNTHGEWKNVFNENFWWCYFSSTLQLCFFVQMCTDYIGSILGWNFPVCVCADEYRKLFEESCTGCLYRNE